MREVIITKILYRFGQKNRFFEGWSWFKFNNLELVLGMTLKFYCCVEKRLKLKVRKFFGKVARNLFALPLLLFWIGWKVNWQIPVLWKPLKRKNISFIASLTCSVEINCIVTVIILENVFGNIKSAVFTYRGIGKGENVLLSLHVCKCSVSASVRYLFIYLLYLRLEQS